MTVRYVGVGAAGQQVGITDGVLQQTEEDGGYACPRHAVIGTDCTARYADDIGIVVIGEQRRHCGLGIVNSDPAVFACIGRVLAPVQSVALRRHGLDPVVIAALGDLCLCPAVPVGLIDAEPCIRSGPDTPQLKFGAAQRRTVPGIELGEPERVAGVTAITGAVPCPLCIEDQVAGHCDPVAGLIGSAASVRLGVPPGEGTAVACIAVCLYCGCFTGSVDRGVGGHAGVSAVPAVGHGKGLGGHLGPADLGGDHDRRDGTAVGYCAADMSGGVQIFTGVEIRCRQYAGAFQGHDDRGLILDRSCPIGHRFADDRDRVTVGADCDTALVHLKDAGAVKVIEELAGNVCFRSQAAVQFHNKGHGRDIGRCRLQHTEQAVRHGVGHGIGDFISAAGQVRGFL